MKFIFCMQINIEVFSKTTLSFCVSVTRHVQSTQNKFAYLCNISIKAWEMKLIFCLQINLKVFYKMIVSLWVCIARQAQSTRNNQFTISLQYLKEKMKDEVDFLPADKWYGQAFPKFPKQQVCNLFAISLKRSYEWSSFWSSSSSKLLKVALSIFDEIQTCPKYPKNQNC